MSTGTQAITATVKSRSTLLATVADFVELTKPRIAILELITVMVGMRLASATELPLGLLISVLLGTSLVAASASALNQWLERHRDGQMQRTASRPLPSGRLTDLQVCGFGLLSFLGGVLLLGLRVNWVTALVGTASWAIYLLLYTPLKSRSTLNTAVGAVSGALPILMGWTAVGGSLNLVALSLVSVLYLWQFPHFMAIAWLYRDDYAAADYRMATTVDPSGVRAGAIGVAGALALLPISLIPALAPQTGSPWVYCGWALALGGLQLHAALTFMLRRNDTTARRLLRASLVYLPCWLGILLMVSW